jgi:hypothetical protein
MAFNEYGSFDGQAKHLSVKAEPCERELII